CTSIPIYRSIGGLPGGCSLAGEVDHQWRTPLRVRAIYPELGAPAGIRLPIARAYRQPASGGQGKEAPAATRRGAQGEHQLPRARGGWRGGDFARKEHVGTFPRAMGIVAASAEAGRIGSSHGAAKRIVRGVAANRHSLMMPFPRVGKGASG